MLNNELKGFDLWLARHMATYYGVYAVAFGIFWILFGFFRAAMAIIEVGTNGLGRYATHFGLSRLPEYTHATEVDVFFFVVVLTAAIILIASGFLVGFRRRIPLYSGMACGGVFFLLALMPGIVSQDFSVVLFLVAVPSLVIITGISLHHALRVQSSGYGSVGG